MTRRVTGSGTPDTRRSYLSTAKNVGIDLDELHRYLWKHSDRQGKLLLKQTQIGEELGLYPMQVTRIVKALVEEERIVRAKQGLIFVNDPDSVKWTMTSS